MGVIMDKNDFVKNIMMLNILSQSACESGGDGKKSFLLASDKVLFLVDAFERVSPTFLTQKLRIAKSNMALMCKKLVCDGFLAQTADLKDKRIVYYSLTQLGKDYLDEKLSEIQNNLEAVCMTDNIDNINSCIIDINEILSKRF